MTLIFVMNAKEAGHVFCLTIGRRGKQLRYVLKILRRALVTLEHPDIISVDNLAFRKGHGYGIIICNIQTHRLIELFHSCNLNELFEWID